MTLAKYTFLVLFALRMAGVIALHAEDRLKNDFQKPPASARPWVFYFVLNGNMTKESITADFESMARVGIGGIIYSEISQASPQGPAPYAGPLWMELIQHSCKEGQRLGLQINMSIGAGSVGGGGGPWISPAQSMQKVVWTETQVEGGKRFDAVLAKPAAVMNYYQDIVVLAFPTPAAEAVNMAAAAPKLSSSGESPKPGQFTLPRPEKTAPQYVQFEFTEPFAASALSATLGGRSWITMSGEVQASEDGQNFKPVHTFAVNPTAMVVNFPRVKSRFFRVAFNGVDERGLTQLEIGNIELHQRYRVAKFEDKNGLHHKGEQQRWPAPADWPVAEADAVIPRDRIVDLTGKMDAAGKLTHDFPAGSWTVLRFGHTTTGRTNGATPKAGSGLECDKLSKETAKVMFDGLIGRLAAENKDLTGQDKVLVSTFIDSWEVGSQNWTPLMREEFRQRRGYELWKCLPVLTGRVVDNVEETERFLWDFRQTISDMLVENYAGEVRRLAHERGMRLSMEAYGNGPFNELAFANQADEPIGEFWGWTKYRGAYSCTEMASAAHIYGRKIVGAEAFTAQETERWQAHPANMKELGDWAFCEGINRFVFHRYAAQPWTNRTRVPGMALGPWGVHYERTQTWWEQSTAWHAYLARCQYLLQQGLFVADVVYLQPEGAPHTFAPPAGAEIASRIRGGYNFDGCPSEVVLERMAVKNGRIVLPDGMSYAVLVLPEVETMTPRLLHKISQLADQGALMIAGNKPPQKSPSLSDFGHGDAEVKQLADKLWSGGKIITGKTAAEVLGARGVKPDFSATPAMRYIHRTIGDADVYFVANPEPKEVAATAAFRVTGKQPQFWWPDSGRTANVLAFEEKEGVTRVPLRLEPNGSVFVVFRKSVTDADPLVSATRNGQPVFALTSRGAGNLTVQKALYGIPDDPQRTRDVTTKVQALINDGKPTIRVGEMANGDDPAGGIRKTLVVDYTADGHSLSVSGQDGDTINISPSGLPPVLDLAQGEIRQSGHYLFTTASGKSWGKNVSLPEAQGISGPWELAFDPKWGGPTKVRFEKLDDWSKRPEEGIKYYSGTVIYKTAFTHTRSAALTKTWLDLGKVAVMAEVKLNGKDLGILWKPPFRVEVSNAIRSGENQLEVKVVNLLINRQIGDEQLPEDSERKAGSFDQGTLKADTWPQWLQEGKPSPTGRFTFGIWRQWSKNDPLAESGLLGPVTIQATEAIK